MRFGLLLAGGVMATSVWRGAQARTPAAMQAGADQPLTVAPSATSGFDDRVTGLIGRWAPAALKCKPFLAIVSNRGPRTVVAYSVMFSSQFPDGRYDKRLVQFKYPTAVSRADDNAAPVRRDRELGPGEERVVTPDFEIDPTIDNWWIEQVCGDSQRMHPLPKDLKVSIDAAILDEGSVFGDPENELSDHFKTFVTVTQALYHDVAERLRLGEAPDAVFARVEAEFAKARQRERESRDVPDLDAQYFQVAASDLRRWRAKVGDAVLRDSLPKTIRSKAFTMVRR